MSAHRDLTPQAPPAGVGFSFDARFCSGCKACQVACKDKHGLEVGRLWRRVYEISAGGWQPAGADGCAWQPQVVTYNLSIACNHCRRPVCVEVCPTSAMQRRPDGIVLVDAARCIGCQYCAMACPYGAPQYHPAAGVMTKCTLCVEESELGLPPACVAACPLRTLDCAEGPLGLLSSLAPLPDPALTQPALVLPPLLLAALPGRNAGQPELLADLRVVNREEVCGSQHGGEHSLAAFTLLAPLAVGLFAGLGLAGVLAPASLSQGAPGGGWPLWTLFLLPAGVMTAALGVSLAHLGHPWRAWRSLANLSQSWLSREVLLAGLTLAGMAGFGLLFQRTQVFLGLLFTLTVVCGLGLLYAIGRVYALPTIPPWHSAAGVWQPWLTALALGGLAAGIVLPGGALLPGLSALSWLGAVALLVSVGSGWAAARRLARLAPALLQPGGQPAGRRRSLWLRLALAVAAVIALLLHLPAAALLCALADEYIGRVQFYQARPE